MQTVVDWVEVTWHEGGARPWLRVHFHNLDEAGEIMPGAGGYVDRQITGKRQTWDAEADKLVLLVEQTGRRWVEQYDDFTDDKTPFALLKAELAQYEPGKPDCGGHFRFQRADDIFASSILFEDRGGAMSHNQKRPVADTKMREAIRADILTVVSAGQKLAALINGERTLSKKDKSKKGA